MAIKRGSKIDMGSSSASMTDMMFLLLIFLMIATTLINSNSLKLTLPQSTSPSKDKAVVLVSITPDLKFWVGDNEVVFEQLESVLAKEMAGAEEQRISLRADKSVPINEVVMVMNIAKRNNYKLDLATNPE